MSEGDLLRGWAVSLARHVAIAALGIVWLALIARSQSEAEVGALILVLALPALLGPLLNLGLPLGASFLTARESFPPSAMVAWARRVGLQLAAGSAIAVALGLGLVALFGVKVNVLVGWGLLAVPPAMMTSMGAASFQGRRMFGRQAQILVAPISLTTGATLLIVGGWDPDAADLVAVVVASHFVAASWVLWLLRFGRRNPKLERAIRRDAWAFSWRAYLSEGAAAIRGRLDLFLVGALLGTAAAATFGTATALASQVALLSMAAYQVVLPFSASAASIDGSIEGDLTPLTARTSLVLTLGAAIAIAAISQPLLRLLYGEEFVDGWTVLIAYLPSVVLLSLSRILTADLSGRGEIATVLRISLFATAFGLIVLPLGIAVAGAVGAAAAGSVTALVNTALRVRAYSRIASVPTEALLKPRAMDLSLLFVAARRSLLGAGRRGAHAE